MLPALGCVNIQQAVCWMYPGGPSWIRAKDFLQVGQEVFHTFAAAWPQHGGSYRQEHELGHLCVV